MLIISYILMFLGAVLVFRLLIKFIDFVKAKIELLDKLELDVEFLKNRRYEMDSILFELRHRVKKLENK